MCDEEEHRCSQYDSSNEELWEQAGVDFEALAQIISSHFKESCRKDRDLPRGAFARVFLYVLESGKRVVARVALPIREYVKTESEVAAMHFVKCECFRQFHD